MKNSKIPLVSLLFIVLVGFGCGAADSGDDADEHTLDSEPGLHGLIGTGPPEVGPGPPEMAPGPPEGTCSGEDGPCVTSVDCCIEELVCLDGACSIPSE